MRKLWTADDEEKKLHYVQKILIARQYFSFFYPTSSVWASGQHYGATIKCLKIYSATIHHSTKRRWRLLRPKSNILGGEGWRQSWWTQSYCALNHISLAEECLLFVEKELPVEGVDGGVGGCGGVGRQSRCIPWLIYFLSSKSFQSKVLTEVWVRGGKGGAMMRHSRGAGAKMEERRVARERQEALDTPPGELRPPPDIKSASINQSTTNCSFKQLTANQRKSRSTYRISINKSIKIALILFLLDQFW